MNINVKLNSGSTLSLSETRMQHMLQGNESKALHMGAWDRFIDWFQGGTKAEAVRELYESLHHPRSGPDSQPGPMLDRFQQLKELAEPQFRNQFVVEHESQPDSGQWTYRLKLGDEALYDAGPLRETPNQRHGDFAKRLALHQALDTCFANTQAQYEALKGLIEDPQSHLMGYAQSMADSKDMQQLILREADNPHFSAANFKRIVDGDKPAEFKAVFDVPGQGEQTLVLSNRSATNGEFRGARLRERLAQPNGYGNLRELMEPDHLGPHDTTLKMCAVGNLAKMLSELKPPAIPEGTDYSGYDGMPRFFDDLDRFAPEGNPFFTRMLEYKLGKTNLAELCFPQQMERLQQNLAAPALQRAAVVLLNPNDFA